MLVALSAIVSCHSAPTEDTMEKALFFLDYAASHPDAILTYVASDMVLSISSDASYIPDGTYLKLGAEQGAIGDMVLICQLWVLGHCSPFQGHLKHKRGILGYLLYLLHFRI